MINKVDLSSLIPLMEEVFASGGEFTITPGGNSMRPMLYGGRDSVTLVKPQGRLKKYDLPLYLRADGAFVLHRVVKVLPDGYVMRGDCVVSKEYGITDKDIIGVVKRFTRKGKAFTVKNRVYRIYCRFWNFFSILRRFVMHFNKQRSIDL